MQRIRRSRSVAVAFAAFLLPLVNFPDTLDGMFSLQSELWLPRARTEVFSFFADARNLERITPAWLRFEVLTPAPIEMKVGARIDYKLRLHGIPLHWQSEITVWEPPRRFADRQTRGPYRVWIHEHTFEEREGGTLVRDRVNYSLPGGRLANWLFASRDLEKIFAYRREKLCELFGTTAAVDSVRNRQ